MDVPARRMNQDEFIYQYNDKNREQFNPKLFERDEYEIIKEIEKVILSCERNRYFTLKVKSFRVIEGYEDIHNTLYEHEERKNWKKNKVSSLQDIQALDALHQEKAATASKRSDANTKKNRFNDFPQRSYDTSQLEKELLKYGTN